MSAPKTCAGGQKGRSPGSGLAAFEFDAGESRPSLIWLHRAAGAAQGASQHKRTLSSPPKDKKTTVYSPGRRPARVDKGALGADGAVRPVRIRLWST